MLPLPGDGKIMNLESELGIWDLSLEVVRVKSPEKVGGGGGHSL